MQKLILTLLIIYFQQFAYSQSADLRLVTSSGNFGKQNQLQIDHSAGVVIYYFDLGQFENRPSIFQICPNPTNDAIRIKAPETANPIQSLVLINSLGQTIQEKKIAIQSSNYFWDISQVASGIYMLVIWFSNGEKISNKLIKQ